jgi:hypothetical protein
MEPRKRRKHHYELGNRHSEPTPDLNPPPESSNGNGDPATNDREYSDEEFEFLKAIDAYRRNYNRPFPTWSEALAILRRLGWRREKRQDDPPS